MTKQAEVLKACPWCGSPEDRPVRDDKMSRYVLCEYCDVRAPRAIWNRRAVPEQEGLAEGLPEARRAEAPLIAARREGWDKAIEAAKTEITSAAGEWRAKMAAPDGDAVAGVVMAELRHVGFIVSSLKPSEGG